MFKNIIRHSLRNLRRQKAYVLINVIGLAVGIASSLIISLYVFHELSYDNFHENKESIYRVILNGKIGEQEVNVSATPTPMGSAILDEFPEIEDFTRLNIWGEILLKYDNEIFKDLEFVEVDSSFFSIFSFKLLKGDPFRVLNEPNVLVLSESTAKTIFGDEDPIGKMINVQNQDTPYRVTGLMADFPETSHLNADVLASFMTNPRADDGQWLSNSFSTYVLLKSGTKPEQVNARFPEMIKKYIGPDIEKIFGVSIDEFLSQGNKYSFYLQGLGKVHLDPSIEGQSKPATDPKYLYIFGVISILIIVIASINFMNLSTAQASKRAKEVGMKKVSGSSRVALIAQFLSESVLLSFFALLISLLIIQISLPHFGNLLGIEIQTGIFQKWYYLPGLIAFSIFVGLFAGSYPSFYLSSFNPIKVLKSGNPGGKSNRKLRSILVIIQFSISIILIVGTSVMFRQINYMLNKDMGFNKENVLVISSAGTIGDKVKSFKEAVKKFPDVISISSSTAVPGRNNNTNGYGIEGRNEESFLLQTNWVDYDYLETYGLKIKEGRFFDESFMTDKDACVINASTITQFGLEEPLGLRFMAPDDDGMKYVPIIGAVNNFHFTSLENEIQPYILRFKAEDVHWGYLSVKLAANFNNEIINQIEDEWKVFSNGDPMDYFFIDDSLEIMYKSEKQNAQLAIIFSILGLLIAALGLFGLTSFMLEQRTKEIGVRKAMGASIESIFGLISREVIILIIISALIGWPIIYYFAKSWLQNYYYRIELGVMDLLPGLIVTIIIAILTISFKILKTSRINPANSLRYE